MDFMNGPGLITGTSDATLSPAVPCTIEQAVIAVLHSLDAGKLGWHQNIDGEGNYGIDTSVRHLYGDRTWITSVCTTVSGNTLTFHGNCIDPYGHRSHIKLDKCVAPIKDR